MTHGWIILVAALSVAAPTLAQPECDRWGEATVSLPSDVAALHPTGVRGAAILATTRDQITAAAKEAAAGRRGTFLTRLSARSGDSLKDGTLLGLAVGTLVGLVVMGGVTSWCEEAR